MLNCAYLENRRTGTAATPANLTRYAIYYTPQRSLLDPGATPDCARCSERHSRCATARASVR